MQVMEIAFDEELPGDLFGSPFGPED